MNIVSMMNEAWEVRNKYSHEECEVKFKNLLSHGFVAMEKFLSQRISGYDENTFYAVQRVLVWLILADGDFLQGEYDAYLKYCEWANFEPLSVDDVKALYNRMTKDDIIREMKLLASTRQYISQDDYECFVLSLCFMALLGDREMDENEYYLIACFFTYDSDHCPSWAQFKEEWV